MFSKIPQDLVGFSRCFVLLMGARRERTKRHGAAGKLLITEWFTLDKEEEQLG